jgi:hypothetical protein
VHLAKFGNIQNMKVKNNLKYPLILLAFVMNLWQTINSFSKIFVRKMANFRRQKFSELQQYQQLGYY